MSDPVFAGRGKPVDQGKPAFAGRGRPAAPAPKPNYKPRRREMNVFEAVPVAFAAGGAFGQRPKILATGSAMKAIPDAIRQKSFAPIQEGYRQGVEYFVDEQDRARAKLGLAGIVVEGAPAMATGSGLAKVSGQAVARFAPNLAPRVAAALAPRAGSAASKVARFGGRTALAGGGGAVAGGIYGSGEGRGAEGALYGAVGGAVAEPVVRGGVAVVRGARRLVRKPAVKPDVKAARVILNPISGHIDLAKAQAQIDEAKRLGLPPLSLVDVMKNSGKRFVRGVASNTTDDAQEMAVDYAMTTRENMPENALSIVRKITGKDVDLAALRKQADDALEAVDKANYGALEPLRVKVDPALMQDLGTNQATFAAKRSAKAANTDRRYSDEAALDRIADALRQNRNYDAFGQNVSLQGLEDVYRVMRDRGIGMKAAEGPQAVQRREGFSLSREANRLGESLANRFPEIADARMASQQARQNIEAIDLGYNAFTKNRVPSELAADIGQLPARRNVLSGAQARLQQEIGENPLNALGSLGYKTNQRARLAAMGAPADDIVAASRIEARRARTADFISPNTGSQSQLRATDLPEGIASIPTTSMGWANKLMDFAFRRINAFTPAEFEAIVRMGIEPADLQALQALAARDPDKIPSVVKGLLGTAGGIGVGGQINSSGTNRGYPQ